MFPALSEFLLVYSKADLLLFLFCFFLNWVLFLDFEGEDFNPIQ